MREKLHISVNIVLDPKCLDTTSDISRFTPFTDINNMRSAAMNIIGGVLLTKTFCPWHLLCNHSGPLIQ